MGYNFPPVPAYETAPGLQTALLALFGVALVIFTGQALLGWRRTGSPIGIALLLGGFVASLDEALDDIAALCWYPVKEQIVGYETMLTIPLWLVLSYAAYFGGATYWLYGRIQGGMTKRALWITFGCLLATEAVFEPIVTHLHGYNYFGHQPFAFFGMPLFWFVTNFTGMFIALLILVKLPHLFTGWRAWLAVLIPPVSYAAGAFGSSWAVFNAIRTESTILVNLAQILALAIGFSFIGWAISQLAVDGQRGRAHSQQPLAGPDQREFV